MKKLHCRMVPWIYISLAILPSLTNALTPTVISSYISAPGKVIPGSSTNTFKVSRNVTLEQCAADCSLQYQLQLFPCYAFEYMPVAKVCALTNLTTLALKGGYLGLLDNLNMNYFERSKGPYISLFQPYANQVLEDQRAYFAVFHNMTLEKCALFCLIETRSTCMSFSYSVSKNVCGLSKVFFAENNGQKMVSSNTYNHYQYSSSWPCNATVPWNYSPTAIASPYFPYASVKDVHCHLVLEAPVGMQVDLVFTTFFALGNLCDKQPGGIKVHDGFSKHSTLLAELCSSENFVNRRFQSSSGYLYVDFATGSVPLAFKAVYDFIEDDPCSFMPCKNNGTCYKNGSHYTCACVQGYSGTNCNTSDNACASNPCYMGGTCVSLVNGFWCKCPNLLGGTRCDKFVGLCYTDPCQNGGQCTPRGTDRYVCQCPSGWEGTNCTVLVHNPCAPNPCNNGATCIPAGDQRSFTCICSTGFTGVRCQNNINECESNPCTHNSPCIDLVNDYKCECSSFMAGKNCEEFVGRCRENPCVHGTCSPTGRENYTCACEAAYTGNRCETRYINYCDPNPCKHGRCQSFPNGPSCECDFGYNGFLCDSRINFCDEINCTHGECINGDDNFRCRCIDGYEGKFCNETINHCLEADCNGGYCINTMTSHFCVCLNGKTGLRCHSDVNRCDSSTCKNGTCIGKNGVFSCICRRGFTGGHCDTLIDYCISNPCQHGKCTNEENDYRCACEDNYTGKTCDSEIDHCYKNPCVYGFCQNLKGRFQCICASGFHGELCQFKQDELVPLALTNTTALTGTAMTTDSHQVLECSKETCKQGNCEPTLDVCLCLPGFGGQMCDKFKGCNKHNPCYHGNCTDTPVGFTCSCDDQYTGQLCGTKLPENDPCITARCQNGGVCVRDASNTGVTPYSCLCREGFAGAHCEINKTCDTHACSIGDCTPVGSTFRCELRPLTGASGSTAASTVKELMESQA